MKALNNIFLTSGHTQKMWFVYWGKWPVSPFPGVCVDKRIDRFIPIHSVIAANLLENPSKPLNQSQNSASKQMLAKTAIKMWIPVQMKSDINEKSETNQRERTIFQIFTHYQEAKMFLVFFVKYFLNLVWQYISEVYRRPGSKKWGTRSWWVNIFMRSGTLTCTSVWKSKEKRLILHRCYRCQIDSTDQCRLLNQR